MSEGRYAIVREGMYKTLREIADYCGIETAQEMVRVFGGGRIWVPNRWTPGHLLNRLGEQHARKLVDVFGNSSIDVPRRLLTAEGLSRVIATLRADGMDQRDIARLIGCSQRTVSRRQHEPVSAASRRTSRRADPRQIDLEELLRK